MDLTQRFPGRHIEQMIFIASVLWLLYPLSQNIHAEPLPKVAQSLEIPEKGYIVKEVKDGLYWVTAGGYLVMFLTTGEGVILVDAPPSMGKKLTEAIAEVTDESVTHLIYSHRHSDHIAGASAFESVQSIIAHEETKKQLVRVNDSHRPIPTTTFSDRMTLRVGTQELELSYPGPNHTIGNIFIYAAKQKVLMLVDVVTPGWASWINLGAANVLGFYDAVEHILTYDFDVFIGGHPGRIGTRPDVELSREYYLAIQEQAAEAIKLVKFDDIAKSLGDTQDTFLLEGTYLDAVAQKCYDLTLPDWKHKLGGVQPFLHSSCGVVASSLMID